MSKSRSESTPDHKLPKYTPRKLRLLRNWALGLSQEELAEKAECDARTVQRYEKGDSPIPSEFIRRFEELRVEERERRARELGADEIDFSNLLIPGLELIELIPEVHVRELLGKLTRMFVAVPKEWLPPSTEGGQPPPSPDSGPSLSGRSTRQAASVTRAEFRIAMAGLACVCVVILGAVVMLRSELQTAALRSARSLRVARDTKVERPAAPPAAAREQPAPDAVDEQPDDASTEREPLQVPGQLYTDKAKEEMGAGGKTKRSIKMPDKLYSWQKAQPCDPGEVEKVGGCWFGPAGSPPCPEYAVESEGQCFVPAPAKPQKPNTVTPEK